MSALVRVPGESLSNPNPPIQAGALTPTLVWASDFTSLLWNLEFLLLAVSEFSSAENKNDPCCKFAV